MPVSTRSGLVSVGISSSGELAVTVGPDCAAGGGAGGTATVAGRCEQPVTSSAKTNTAKRTGFIWWVSNIAPCSRLTPAVSETQPGVLWWNAGAPPGQLHRSDNE